MLVFEYELLLIQLIGTTVSVAMETMNICIIHLHFCRVYGVFFSLIFTLRRSLLLLCFSDVLSEVCNEGLNTTSQPLNGYEFSHFFLFFIKIHEF